MAHLLSASLIFLEAVLAVQWRDCTEGQVHFFTAAPPTTPANFSFPPNKPRRLFDQWGNAPRGPWRPGVVGTYSTTTLEGQVSLERCLGDGPASVRQSLRLRRERALRRPGPPLQPLQPPPPPLRLHHLPGRAGAPRGPLPPPPLPAEILGVRVTGLLQVAAWKPCLLGWHQTL